MIEAIPAKATTNNMTMRDDDFVGEEETEKIRQSLDRFHEILLSIPNEEKRAYLQALEQCPELIEKESNPVMFLRYKDFQVWAAVQNFVDFWQLRVDVYKDRAFLPINFTGQGALDDVDLEAMESGEFCFLPDDIHGNPTILICPRTKEKEENFERFFKQCVTCSFAIRLICAQRQAKEGYNVVFIPNHAVSARFMKMPSFAHFLRTHDLIPSPQRGLFTLIPESDDNGEEEEPIVTVADGIMYNKNTFWNYLKPLSGHSKEEIFQKLEKGGFRREGIPNFLGGTWDAFEFKTWLHKQREEDASFSSMETPKYTINSSIASEETSSDIDKNLKEFYRILESIADDQKKAYLEARTKCPELIEKESHPLLFLRHQNFDIFAAAQNFVGFWELRVDLLQERAFLPLNLTGEGAIDEETCRWIESGIVAILPKVDGENSHVLLDTTVCPEGDLETTAFHLIKALYFLRVLCAQRAIPEGLSVLYYHNEVAPSIFQAYSWYSDKFKMIPQQLKSFLAIVPDKENADWLETNKGSFGEDITPVFGGSPEELTQKLESHGLTREGLPVSMGGSWDISVFISWAKDYRVEDPTASVLSPPTYAVNTAGPSERSEKLREFYAILSSLPPYEKRGYLNALELCPELIERECPPKLFLKASNYHVWGAVREFVSYWEFRQEVFGDRAFLPINFTGQGALDPITIDVIASGSVAFLPSKKDGSLVVLVKPPESTEDIEVRAARLARAYFALNVFVAHTMAEFSVIEIESDVGSHMRSTPEGITTMKRFTSIPTLPGKFFRILTVDSEEARQNFHKGMTTSKSVLYQELNPFAAISDNEIRENLSLKGFTAERLPTCLGGSWDLSNMASWVEDHRNDDPASSLLIPPNCALMECMDAESDLIGDVGSEEMSADEAIARVEEVIRLLPDCEEKTAYKEALIQAADLIQTESNPLWYIRAASFDAWDAAKRLTTYWHYRKQWFGERAHLPLDLSGSGALTMDDIAVLRDGTAQLLPSDKVGRPVIFLRRLPCHSEESTLVRTSRLRILLYLMTLAHQIYECQESGVVFIIYYGEAPGHFRPFDWRESEKFTNVGVASRNTRGYLLSPQGATTGPAQPQIIKQLLTRDINIIPLSSTKSENTDKMKSIGLLDTGIPDDLGGSWYPLDFEAWLEQQHSAQTTVLEDMDVKSEEVLPLSVPKVDVTNEQYILLARLEAALSDIGLNDKIDLLTARASAPALVASESPPAKFLRCENFDFPKAARRWCSYWKGRKKLFCAKALLPIKQYDAVLSRKEKLYADGMTSRAIAVDRDGRSIIAFSGRRPAESDLTAESIARCYFAIVQRLIENDKNQTDGIVMFREWIPSKFLPSVYKMMDEIITAMMPLRVSAHHLLCVLPESGKLCFYQSISSRLFGVSSESLAQKTNVHLADNKQGLKELMISIGVDVSHLPTIFSTEIWESCEDSSVMSESDRQSSIDDGTVNSQDSSLEEGDFDIDSVEEYMEKLDSSESTAFFEAQKMVPELVQRESNPNRFLVLEKGRRSRAVRRLARYWNERKRIFGERAFLPLNQTGEGALSKDDIAVLNNGFLSVLQNDKENVPVGIFDGARAVPQQIETSLRIIFYVGSVLCEYDVEESMTCRFILIASVLSLDCGLDKLFTVIETALPIRIKDMFILPAPCERSKTTFQDSVAPQVMKLLGPRHDEKIVVVRGDTGKERCAEMVKHGFTQHALPIVAGGEWNFAQFFQWQETRTRIEWGLPLSTVQKASIPKGMSYSVPSLSELPEKEQTERKRRLNLLHSRRKREKERAQIEALQDQVADLEDTNRRASEENARLEQAIHQASQYLPGSSGPIPSPVEDRKPAPILAVGNRDSDPIFDSERGRFSSADHDMMADSPAYMAARSSGNKRILEEFLLQQERVSVPSSVWMHMINTNRLQQRQQSHVLQQFLSGMDGRNSVSAAGGTMPLPPPNSYNNTYPPPPNTDDERKRQRF